MNWASNTELGLVARTSTDEDLRRRVLSRIVITPTRCWQWVSTLNEDGYGKVVVAWRTNGQPVRRLVHRVMYELDVDPIPSGLEIDHLCRNHGCCNPRHLEPVTRKENVNRGVVPAMMKAKAMNQTHCKRGHLYVETNKVITNRKTGAKTCRTCRNEYKRSKYHEQKRIKTN